MGFEKVYACKECKCGFFLEEGEDPVCYSCGNTIINLKDYEELTCPHCKKTSSVLELEMKVDGTIIYSVDDNDERLQKIEKVEREKTQGGKIRCPDDYQVLVWDPLKTYESKNTGISENLGEMDKEGDFSSDPEAWKQAQELDFEASKAEMQRFEAAIFKALENQSNKTEVIVNEQIEEPNVVPDVLSVVDFKKEFRELLEEEKDDRETTTVEDLQKKLPQDTFSQFIVAAKQAEENEIEVGVETELQTRGDVFESTATVELLDSSEPSENTESVEILKSEVISPKMVEDPAIPEIKEFTPFADQFWKYYFDNPGNKRPNSYFGDSGAAQKVLGLIKEVRTLYFNKNIIDIRKPIVENVPPNSNSHLYIIGDTHGSLTDTEKIIKLLVEKIEEHEKNNNDDTSRLIIVFLGDYVDRNIMDVHNILYILSFAVKYSKYVRLLRGNHEEATVNINYRFNEHVEKFLGSKKLFEEFELLFSNIPLIHVTGVGSKNILCLHGGIPFYDLDPAEMPFIPEIFDDDFKLSCEFPTIDDLDNLSQQILWSDPAHGDLPQDVYYLPSRRGLGFNFGEKLFDEWMSTNNTHRLIRAHEVFLDGYDITFNERLFSIFSCTEYVNRKINGRVMHIDFSKKWEDNYELIEIKELP